MSSSRRRRSWLLLSLAAASIGATIHAREKVSAQREIEIEVAILFRIAELVEWPAEAVKDPDSPITFCVVGADPFGDTLDALEGRKLNGRAVRIRRFEDVHELEYCPVLFVSSSEQLRQAQLLEALKESPVLTIGETKDFAESGGVIEFVHKIHGVGYEVNIAAAEAAGLKLDRKVVNLAHRVLGRSARRR